MRALPVLLALLIAQAPAASQQSAPAEAAATIRGRVLALEDPVRPLRRARVTITWSDNQSVRLLPDNVGRFETAARRPAGYSIEVSKPGYAPEVVRGPVGGRGLPRLFTGC